MADDKPFGGLDSFTPVQSGFTPSANAPVVKKATWTEKFEASQDLTWASRLYANSDYAQDFERDTEFSFTEDQQLNINTNYEEVWAKDLLDSQSQSEFDFKTERATNAKENYKTLGDMGFGTVTALLSAGALDPAYIPLYFMPYANLTAGASKVTGAARIGKYLKSGALIGAGEGTLVGAAEYMLRPDAQLRDVFYGAALGAGVGGAMGGVAARLMRDVDAEHFVQTQIKLTQAAEAKLANHTPMMKQKRTVDTLTDPEEVSIGALKVRTVKRGEGDYEVTIGPDREVSEAPLEVETTKIGKGDYLVTVGKDVYSVVKGKSRWVLRKNGEEVSKHTSLKKATASLQPARVVDEFDEIIEEVLEDVVENVTVTRSTVINSLTGTENRVLNELEDSTEIITLDDLATASGYGDKELGAAIQRLEEEGLVARTQDDFGDEAYVAIDAGDFADRLEPRTRQVTRKTTKKVPKGSATPEQKFNAEAEKAQQEEFGDPTPEQVAEDVRDLGLPEDLSDVPTLIPNIWDTFRIRKRLSAIALLTQSANPVTRHLAMKMALVSSGLKDKAGKLVKIPQNASIHHMIYHRKYTGQLAQILRKVDQTDITQAEINKRIFHHLNGDTTQEMTDSMLQAADEVKAMKKEMLEVGIKLGVFDKSQAIEDFMPRMFQPELLDVLAKMASKKDIKKAFIKWIRSANPDMDEAVIARAAGKYWKSLSTTVWRQKYTRTGESRNAAVDEDVLRKILLEADDDGLALTEEQVDALILTKDIVRGKSKNVHARSRMNIDDKLEVNIPYKEGHPQHGASFTYKLTDLIDTNTERVMGVYIHRMAGATSLARVGIDGDATFSKMLEDIVTDNLEKYNIPSDQSQREARSLQYIYESLRGSYNANEGMDTVTKKTLRRLRELNFIRLMGISGLAGVIESSNVLFENGVRNALANIPAFASLVKRAKDGKLSNELAQEFEEAYGLGMDIITGKMNSRYEDYTDMHHVMGSDYTKTDEVLAKGRNFISVVGGLSPVTVMLSRLNSVNFTTNMYKKLSKGNLNVFSDVKLKQLGLGTEELTRIKAAMDDLATVGADGRLKTLNLSRWEKEHPEAFNDFSYALNLDTSQNIQITNIGSTNAVIRSEWGKSLFQFWGYVLGSNEQQYARQMVRIRHGDAAVPMSIFMGGLVVASMAYMARTTLNSIGRDDREEYLAKKFETGAMSKAVLSYMGMSGMYSLMFNHFGFSPDTLIQNPTVQLIDQGMTGISNIASEAADLDGHGTLYETAKLLENFTPNNPLTKIPARILSEQVIGDPD
tara:strand:+ start:107 stop:3976 length:3870 start_codon:yes stop_codon:yes gene_type:complete